METVNFKNLENLTESEKVELSGGNPILLGIAAGMIGTFIYEVINDWDENLKAFKDGYNKGYNGD
jgi:hypothetical protein